MIYTIRINDKEYEVEVERGKANLIKTTVVSPQPVVASEAASEKTKPDPEPSSASAAPHVIDGTVVRAPMPGTVLDVKVTVGQAVRKGDLLLVLEAMKMENDIRASEDGTVKQLIVAKGSSVSTDDGLLVIQ